MNRLRPKGMRSGQGCRALREDADETPSPRDRLGGSRRNAALALGV
ncbi:hypothetical protein B4135_4236 [Caldibacillus debilis]|uniref:Uncharacterized protein n=1 Tax=Caldibacillus debilis TaxID=301148 RepID=A0A150L5H5_9BACI|nr:hypothetical protein B4135_4236 [Caldibacillus debilis]